jgi:vacuolar-type H+-ATPase subunit F/Vma7
VKVPVHVLCRPAVAEGFALVGLVPRVVTDGPAAVPVLEGHLAEAAPDVLLLEEALYDSLPGELRGRIDRSARPIVVPFPGPVWVEAEPAEARVVDLLRRAIGYRVRL